MFEKCIETIIYNGDHRNEKNTTASKNATQKTKSFKASLNSLTHVEPNHSRTRKKHIKSERARPLLLELNIR